MTKKHAIVLLLTTLMGIEVLRVVLAGQPDAIIGFRAAAGSSI